MTDRKFQIQCFAGGEIVPPLQVWDATQNGTVECGHTLTSFNIGKNPAVAFDSGLAFGLNTRQQQAWMNYGGGLELIRALFKKDGILPIPCGNVGVQMGGFYRKEINSVGDLKGLKFRIGGLGGMILAKLGVVPLQIPTADIYPSLERGAIDAAEWIGPYDDEKLGLHKVARYYYYPGWWEGSAQVTLLVNLQHWEALPESYRAALEAACAEATVLMMANHPEYPDTAGHTRTRSLALCPRRRHIWRTVRGCPRHEVPRPDNRFCYLGVTSERTRSCARSPTSPSRISSRAPGNTKCRIQAHAACASPCIRLAARASLCATAMPPAARASSL
jgi:TRAP-type mannitol/chloroaromatic compound transport system substrate-binding protein